MKFKDHTAADMLAAAQLEDDGYFEVTRGSPSKTPVTLATHVSVQVHSPGPGKHHAGRRIVWRRGNVVVTRRAIDDTLNSWRQP